jgi:uncharacterized protein YqhQ
MVWRILSNCFSRLDITFLIKYQPPQEVDTAEEQKRKFNKCEKKLLYGLFGLQFTFILFAALNVILVKLSGKVINGETFNYLIEAVVYFMILICAIIISLVFIQTVRKERRSLWPTVKTEVSNHKFKGFL